MGQRHVDFFNRPLHDLRISVTDRCNFRCTYCMPKEIFGVDYPFMPPEHLLSFQEIERLATLFVQMGVRKIRLTGGEPLLRENLHLLIEKLVAIPGLEDIGLTTNGFYLERQAVQLKQSGLKRINVSFDALHDPVFKSMNNVGVGTKRILRGIKKAMDVGLEVKVNMVVKKGVNDQEVLPMAHFFKNLHVTLRFIEFMDVGQTNGWNLQQVVTGKEMVEHLASQFSLKPVMPSYKGEVAKRYQYEGTETEVGFITSVSQAFCADCTRGRIAADGKFYTCLFATDGYDLRELLRSQTSDDEIMAAIASIWKTRTDRYSETRSSQPEKNKGKIEMSYIGG